MMNKDDIIQFLSIIIAYSLFIIYHYEIILIKDIFIILSITTYFVYHKEIHIFFKKIIRKIKS